MTNKTLAFPSCYQFKLKSGVQKRAKYKIIPTIFHHKLIRLSSVFFSLSLPSPVENTQKTTAGLSSTTRHQRPRDSYNTFTDTSTILPSFKSIRNLKWSEPHFDVSVPNNVTALVGKSAYLSCKVRNLGNKTVSIASICFMFGECFFGGPMGGLE